MTTARTVEILLAHRDWVRALARSLVADPGLAEDVAQQTLVEAIERPPLDASRPRGWLRHVAANAARALARQQARRQRRERAVARDETVDADPADTAHRAAMHKRLVDELFALEEPYHTVVLLRFFDDLDARAIAARLQRPLATVRTQLQRGLERMRQRLDREFGDRGTWHAALLPLCAARPAVVGVPVLFGLGVLAMGKWILAAAALAAVLFVSFDAFATPAVPVPAAAAGPLPAAAQGASAPADPDRQRTAVAAPAAPETAGTGAAVAAAAGSLRGRVLAVDGSPVAGLTLAYVDPQSPRLDGRVLRVGGTSMDLDQPSLRGLLASDEGIRQFAATFGPHAVAVAMLLRGEPPDVPRATTDGMGRFAITGTDDVEELELEGTDWIRYGVARERGSAEPVLVVGPGVRVAGRVVDDDGVGVAGAFVSIGFTITSLPGALQQLERGAYRSWNDTCARDGAFDLGVVPKHETLEVTAQRRGFEPCSVRTTAIVAPVLWTLRRAAPAPFVLSGEVRGADGAPAAGAVVTFGQDGGKADATGTFSFELTYFDDDTQLVAFLPGMQPEVVDGLGARLRQDPAAGRALRLVLGGEALAIAGHVFDAGGGPRAGITVVLADGVQYGSYDMTVESVIGDQGRDVRTAADGSFALRGLSARDYTVRAIDRETLLVLESGPVAAGTQDLELRAPVDAFLPRVEGVLVDRHGVPVAGATVQVTTVLQRRHRGATLLHRRDAVTSDRDGRFTIENCPRRHVTLSIDGSDVCDASAEVPTDGTPLRVQVARQLHFVIEVANPITAGAFAVLDETGARIWSTARQPDCRTTDYEHELPRQASPVYDVDDRATTLLLLEGKREVKRVPLALRAGELNRVVL